MKWLADLFDKMTPDFEHGGRFERWRPLFDTAQGIFMPPPARTDGPPHVRDAVEIKRYMSMVILALMPSFLSAVYFFGIHVFYMVLVSYVVGGLVEVAFALVRKHDVEEGFLISGLIFPLVLPPTTPLWVVGIGIFFGIFFGKEVFGGTGRNIFNPALVGRLFVTIAFPVLMTSRWLMPHVEAVTTATPLVAFKGSHQLTPELSLLIGDCSGSMGETFRLGILAGGLMLMWMRVSNWRLPVSYLGSVAVFALVGHHFVPDRIAPPLFQLLSGGLLFGAMFMITDPVTAPFTRVGKYIGGTLCGLLTVLIRAFSGYVEGVMFSIVIMNAFTPLIDHLVVTRKYKPRKVVAA